jgi:hypothetical protein
VGDQVSHLGSRVWVPFGCGCSFPTALRVPVSSRRLPAVGFTIIRHIGDVPKLRHVWLMVKTGFVTPALQPSMLPTLYLHCCCNMAVFQEFQSFK